MELKKELSKIEKEIWSYYDVMEYGFREFDHEVNDLTRKKIAVFAKINDGNVWLGNVNLYDEDRGNPESILTKHLDIIHRQTIINFSFSFAIPVYDQALVDMIFARDQAEYTGTKEDYKRVDAIHKRIEELGGTHLIWV